MYDLTFIRRQFPNIADWAFFENAGGTFVPAAVSDRIYDYMRRCQVQPGAHYPASVLAAERIDRSHKKLAAMINADRHEVIIGHSTTLNVYILAHALRPCLQKGDEIIVTNLDHEANNGAWRRLEECGAVIREWKINPQTASLGGIRQLESLLTNRTRLVACTWCSNITGEINPIKEIAASVHAADALLCVDAVAYAPHRALDFANSDADFMLFSLYKLYGPHLGVLCAKNEQLRKLPNQNHFFLAESVPESKLQPGGYLHETAASIECIADYFDCVHQHHFGCTDKPSGERYAEVFELIKGHEDELSRSWMDWLNSQPQVRLIGPPAVHCAQRVPTFSFAVDGRSSQQIAQELGIRGIGVGAGHFYARRCLDAVGVDASDGIVRVSMAHYNSAQEVERLIAALSELLGAP